MICASGETARHNAMINAFPIGPDVIGPLLPWE